LQSIQQIYDFPGIPADAQLVDDLESRQNYFKASRCILLARSHRLRKDYISTLALQERAETYLKHISVSSTSVTHSDIPITKEDVDTLVVTLSSEITRAYTHVVLSQSNSKSSAASKVFLSSTPAKDRNRC
jgi:signal recognition particle subunit SRP68